MHQVFLKSADGYRYRSGLHKWVSADRMAHVGKGQPIPSEQEMELARLRRELAETKQECDLLKKFSAYFAKESR
jgi:transposase